MLYKKILLCILVSIITNSAARTPHALFLDICEPFAKVAALCRYSVEKLHVPYFTSPIDFNRVRLLRSINKPQVNSKNITCDPAVKQFESQKDRLLEKYSVYQHKYHKPINECYLIHNNRLLAYGFWSPLEPQSHIYSEFPLVPEAAIVIDPQLSRSEQQQAGSLMLSRIINHVYFITRLLGARYLDSLYQGSGLQDKDYGHDTTLTILKSSVFSRSWYTTYEIHAAHTCTIEGLLYIPGIAYPEIIWNSYDSNNFSPELYQAFDQILTYNEEYIFDHKTIPGGPTFNAQKLLYSIRQQTKDTHGYRFIVGRCPLQKIPAALLIADENNKIQKGAPAVITRKEPPVKFFDNYEYEPSIYTLTNYYLRWQLYGILKKHYLPQDTISDSWTCMYPSMDEKIRDFFKVLDPDILWKGDYPSLRKK